MHDFDQYQSSFTWRYGSPEMRRIWGEINKRRIWRKIWVAMAEAQLEYGLTTQEQLQDLKAYEEKIDISASLGVEKKIQHDLVAEIEVFSQQASIGRAVIHLGATSMDIKDNTTISQIRDSLFLVQSGLEKVLRQVIDLIYKYNETVVLGFTHLQPAEPTTLGYRLAFLLQDLLMDRDSIQRMLHTIKGKGFTGAVGTSASFGALIGEENLDEFDQKMQSSLGFPFFEITSQTYPRKQDYWLLCDLSSIGLTLSKFAFDLRILQNPAIGEIREFFDSQQIGSSAMPFKRNPIQAEKINSLARMLAQLPRIAWDNGANSLLERTMDDSANQRSILPEAFLIIDELLMTTKKILSKIQIDQNAIQKNLQTFGVFSSIEKLLTVLCQKGGDRQEMHAKLRDLSMNAWNAIEATGNNPLVELLKLDTEINRYLSHDEIDELMDISHYIGRAAERSINIAIRAETMLNSTK